MIWFLKIVLLAIDILSALNMLLEILGFQSDSMVLLPIFWSVAHFLYNFVKNIKQQILKSKTTRGFIRKDGFSV